MCTYIHDSRHKAATQWVNIFELWPIWLNDFEPEKETKNTIWPYILKLLPCTIVITLLMIFAYKYIQVNRVDTKVVNAIDK